MNEAMQQIVERVWTEHIGIPQEWSEEQAQAYFQAEAARLSEMIDQLQIDSQQAVIGQWRDAHEGRDPDYLTQVGLINSARAQAQEVVLSQELYEQIPEQEEELLEPATGEWDETNWGHLPEGDEAWAVAARRNPDRWKTVFRSEATGDVEAAVAALWPEMSFPFQVWMALLWQSRVEDGKPVPAVALPPRTQLRARRERGALMETLAAEVSEELSRNNLRVR